VNDFYQGVTGQTASTLQPQLQQAVTNARGSLANGGLMRGNLMANAANQIGSNYLGDLTQLSGEAGQRSSDMNQAYQNRLAAQQEEQNWEQGNINKALQEKQNEFWTPYNEDQGRQNAEAYGKIFGSLMGGISGGVPADFTGGAAGAGGAGSGGSAGGLSSLMGLGGGSSGGFNMNSLMDAFQKSQNDDDQ
jgi:hypothetical protein